MFNPIIFTRGVESDAFYLILSGKVEVTSGNEGFKIMLTAFNYIGEDALIRDDYKPDFSAKVIDSARLLRISRRQYRIAISSLEQTKQQIGKQSFSSLYPIVTSFCSDKVKFWSHAIA